MSMFYKDERLLKNMIISLCHKRILTCRGRPDQEDGDSLLATECDGLPIVITTSEILHPKASLGLFAARSFGTDGTIGQY